MRVDNMDIIDEWENRLECVVRKLGDTLSYQDYIDSLMMLFQNQYNRIIDFEVSGDFKYVYYYSFDRSEEDVAVILPNRCLSEQEYRSLESYKDYQVHSYLEKDRSYVVLCLFYDYPNDYRIISRLRPVWKRIHEQITPIHDRIIMLEKCKSSEMI